MNKSESVSKIAEALSKAQSTIKNAVKDSDNPFFKSKYADLASVREACQGSLSANGLAVVQFPENREGKLVLATMILHTSGEWLSGELEMTPTKADPQGIGSAITYARRYALAAVTGVATEDDDGNSASGNKPVATTGETRTFGKQRERPLEPTPAATITPELATFNEKFPPVTGKAPDAVEYVSQGQVVNFIKSFRSALDPALQPKAEEYRHKFLAKAGFIDADGNPSAKVIPATRFEAIKSNAMAFAMTCTPF